MNTVRMPYSKTADEVWSFLLGYFEDNGYMPTYQEIADNLMKVRKTYYTKQGVRLILLKMEREGRIKLNRYKLRSIELITK